MGKHYIPREYLRGFTKSDNPNQIWAYSKEGHHFEVSIDKIAQETDMYSDEVESFLNEEVEIPANSLLTKLRNKELLQGEEKIIFSTYMYNLLSRTPDSLEDFYSTAPEILEKIRSDETSKIDKMKEVHPDKAKILEHNKRKLNEAIDILKENPPKEAWEDSIDPNLSELSVPTLSKMKWVFFYQDYDCFITCDRPVFFFKNLGIGRQQSEISFPISSRILLWGSWREDLSEGFYKPENKLIKTMNYRTLSNVYRHAFFCTKKEWVSKAITRKEFPLNLS